jgi:AI-2 transport protein TqsA
MLNTRMTPRTPRPFNRRVQTICLLILTLIALGVTMALLRPVLVPFVLALFFAECLEPVIKLQMRRWGFPRLLAVIVASVLGLSLLTGVGFLIKASVTTMSENLPAYRVGLDRSMQQLLNSRPLHWLGIHPSAAAFPENQTIDFLSGVLSETRNFVADSAAVLVLLAFLLFGRRRPTLNRRGILAEIESRVQQYISLTVLISLLNGLLVAAALAILGVPFAVLFGFFAFLLNFIPNVGGVIATVMPLPIVFLDPHMMIPAKFLAIILIGAIQAVIGSLVQPKMLGNSLQLHPVVLLLALLFFAMIWGIPGAFLATPLTAVIKIIFEKIPATHALAAVLGGDLGPLIQPIDLPDRSD